jgi:hypothetical protein
VSSASEEQLHLTIHVFQYPGELIYMNEASPLRETGSAMIGTPGHDGMSFVGTGLTL